MRSLIFLRTLSVITKIHDRGKGVASYRGYYTCILYRVVLIMFSLYIYNKNVHIIKFGKKSRDGRDMVFILFF